VYRSALVALKPGSSNALACQCAVALADRYRLRLLGIAVIDPTRAVLGEAVPLGGSAYKAKKDGALLRGLERAANETVEAFCGRCKAAGVACDAAMTEGELHATIATAVQRTDLLILGHRAAQDLRDAPSSTAALGAILKHCPRPALVVPALVDTATRVLIACDGSLQAARATQQFVLSGLHEGRQVQVLAIHQEPRAAATVANLAADYLRGHGIAVEMVCQAPAGRLGSQIVRVARSLGAEVLVMGAYGKPTLREFVFGSTTHDILNAAEIPVFLDQ
jgi:nucleotide-binding universal stress UspA family protein